MHDSAFHFPVMPATALLLGLGVVLVSLLLLRPVSSGSRLALSSTFTKRLSRKMLARRRGQSFPAADDHTLEDTLFVLPDISRYTQFMTGNRLALGHAQHVIFSLIEAMIDAGMKKLELSKLEGDAALFFTDVGRHTPEAAGEAVIDIFKAFYRERRRLLEANLCPCKACQSISILDLKIFVHRGRAARFEFRGAVDHFGTDVIVIHRLMKNTMTSHRYVMVTDSASDCVEIPIPDRSKQISEHIEHVGEISATAHVIGDDTVAEWSADTDPGSGSRIADLCAKLLQNARTLVSDIVPNRQG